MESGNTVTGTNKRQRLAEADKEAGTTGISAEATEKTQESAGATDAATEAVAEELASGTKGKGRGRGSKKNCGIKATSAMTNRPNTRGSTAKGEHRSSSTDIPVLTVISLRMIQRSHTHKWPGLTRLVSHSIRIPNPLARNPLSSSHTRLLYYNIIMMCPPIDSIF